MSMHACLKAPGQEEALGISHILSDPSTLFHRSVEHTKRIWFSGLVVSAPQ